MIAIKGLERVKLALRFVLVHSVHHIPTELSLGFGGDISSQQIGISICPDL